MTQESVITQEMRDAIGVESEPITYDVEKGAIIKFAQAIGDDNPLYGDELDAPVSWKGGDLATLAGRPLRLRIALKDADLFALRAV